MKTQTLTFICFILIASIIPCFGQEQWKNPEIDLKLKPRERAIKQYPIPKKTKQTAEDIKGFYEFGIRMSEKFSDSGLTLGEAALIYQLIADENLVRTGSYGTPSPGQKKRQMSEDLQKTVSLKKIEEGLYEIFYSYYGCGTNYVYKAIIIENGKIIGSTRMEKWSGSYPC